MQGTVLVQRKKINLDIKKYIKKLITISYRR